MSIEGKLAFSQLKTNRSRTLWTLLAIMLSEGLITAVCTFVASGNAMLVDLLGPDYGDYGSGYVGLLLIPAVIFGVLIVAMSVTVISNVFRISAQERISQFGILKCTGATQKQIMKTVMFEGLWLSAAAIPAGICLGLLLALGGIRVLNVFLTDLNDLARLMVNEISLTVHFVLSWQAILVSAALCLLTVMYSAWRPARKASRIPAIVCIRGEETEGSAKFAKESRFVKKFFGFEGVLADRNLRRNRKNFRATVISLSVGVILFVGLGGLATQAKGIQDYMKIDIDETVISDYSSGYDEKTNKDTGRKEITYTKPLDRSVCDEVGKKLEQYGNVKIFGMGNDLDTYHTVVLKSKVDPDAREQFTKKSGGRLELPVEIIILDSGNYEKLCTAAGVPTGSTILLNQYSYNDFGHEKDLKIFTSSVDSITLTKADGTSEDVTVDGVVTQDKIPKELVYPNTDPVRLVVLHAQVRGMSWYAAPENRSGYIEYSNRVLEETFAGGGGSSYMENGFSTRTYKTNDYVKVMNIAISLVSVFMYCFVALLMLIGLTNVISTLSTNVMMRAREFAVLKSVGMTAESLRSMLNYESVFCSLKALAIGVPVGLVVTVAINLPIRSMFPIPYSVPWLSLILCMAVVFLITLGTTRYAVHKLDRQNIIETIRSENI